jgi:uncharacterized membrane protein
MGSIPKPAAVAESMDENVVSEVVYTVQENNDASQRFTFAYIIYHIPQTILLVSRSLIEQSSLWLQGLIGGRLGEIIAINIEINWISVIALALIVLLTTLEEGRNRTAIEKSSKKLMVIVGCLVVALSFFVCISWTPINYTTIFGIQGRYYIPILPLFLLSIKSNNLKFKKKPTQQLLFSFCFIVMLVILEAFVIIIRR